MSTPKLPLLPEPSYLGDDASYGYDASDMNDHYLKGYNDAIKAAATEPLIQRIAELERQLEEAANGADALAKKWWARHCETNRHMETTREAHEDFCQLGRAIRALKGAKK